MQTVRDNAIEMARKSLAVLSHNRSSTAEEGAPLWGVILGTLGRQGSFKQLQVGCSLFWRCQWSNIWWQAINHQLQGSNQAIPYVQILLSELSPAKLALFNPHISTFVQTSCPRLSIDWGYAFDRPLLSPYETAVAVGKASSWMEKSTDGEQKNTGLGVYPMDFYAAGTPWALSRSKASFDI